MKDFNVFLSISYACIIFVQQSDQCIETSNGQSLPSFADYDGRNGRINRYYQAIVPSYELQCYGEIRAWGVDVKPGGGRDQGKYTLNLQVWRPSPTVDQMGRGEYNLVGNNRFSAISLSGDVAMVTPSPQDYIQFQPGDVLGVYVEEARDDDDKGVVVLTTDSYTNELVWYASATSQTVAGCPISVGSGGDLTSMLQGAPVISISTETSSSPQILPTPPPCPITPPPTTTMVTEQPTSTGRPTEEATAPETTTERTTEESITTEQTTEEPTATERTTKEPTTTEEPTAPEQTTEEPTTTEESITVTTERTNEEPTTTEPSTEGPMSTTAEESTVHEPTTEEPTSTESAQPTTEAPATTEPDSADPVTPNSDAADSSSPSEIPGTDSTTDDVLSIQTGGGVEASVVAAVVLAILVVIILTVLISVLIAAFMSKKQNKKFNITRTNLRLGIANQIYGQNPSVNDPTYDYVDENIPTIRYRVTSESIIFNEKKLEDDTCYHETVLYHSSGPNTAQGVHSEYSEAAGTHIYDDASVHVLPEGSGQVTSMNPVYEDPVISQPQEYLCPSESTFDMSGMHVPTEVERTNFESANYDLDNKKKYNKLEFFVEDDIYWTPASTTAHLYSQLASKKYREIPRNQLSIQDFKLGSGQFGEVCKAVWSISGATKEIAIKTLRAELPEEEKVRFLQEAAIMGQFSHPNVVKLYGVVTVGEPVMICIELMNNSDLRGYLCSIIPEKKSSRDLEMQFLRFSKQIAAGMEYLAKKSFVHRDLAARNVLLDDILNCKIGDFGLARDLVYETYYTPSCTGGKVPIKWTAPEALLFKKYSTDSDVWSYGMVLFEIWSVGKKPYSKISNAEILRNINTGYNQPPPPGCPRAIYQLMVDCWNPVHSKRPSFSEIGHYLNKSNDHLLQWVEEADTVSSRATELGAPLSEAEALYKDLQNVYADTQ